MTLPINGLHHVTSLASDRMRFTWDAVVCGVPYWSRRLNDTLEALVIAREETARALRMLRDQDLAQSYVASRRANSTLHRHE